MASPSSSSSYTYGPRAAVCSCGLRDTYASGTCDHVKYLYREMPAASVMRLRKEDDDERFKAGLPSWIRHVNRANPPSKRELGYVPLVIDVGRALPSGWSYAAFQRELKTTLEDYLAKSYILTLPPAIQRVFCSCLHTPRPFPEIEGAAAEPEDGQLKPKEFVEARFHVDVSLEAARTLVEDIQAKKPLIAMTDRRTRATPFYKMVTPDSDLADVFEVPRLESRAFMRANAMASLLTGAVKYSWITEGRMAVSEASTSQSAVAAGKKRQHDEGPGDESAPPAPTDGAPQSATSPRAAVEDSPHPSKRPHNDPSEVAVTIQKRRVDKGKMPVRKGIVDYSGSESDSEEAELPLVISPVKAKAAPPQAESSISPTTTKVGSSPAAANSTHASILAGSSIRAALNSQPYASIHVTMQQITETPRPTRVITMSQEQATVPQLQIVPATPETSLSRSQTNQPDTTMLDMLAQQAVGEVQSPRLLHPSDALERSQGRLVDPAPEVPEQASIDLPRQEASPQPRGTTHPEPTTPPVADIDMDARARSNPEPSHSGSPASHPAVSPPFIAGVDPRPQSHPGFTPPFAPYGDGRSNTNPALTPPPVMVPEVPRESANPAPAPSPAPRESANPAPAPSPAPPIPSALARRQLTDAELMPPPSFIPQRRQKPPPVPPTAPAQSTQLTRPTQSTQLTRPTQSTQLTQPTQPTQEIQARQPTPVAPQVPESRSVGLSPRARTAVAQPNAGDVVSPIFESMSLGNEPAEPPYQPRHSPAPASPHNRFLPRIQSPLAGPSTSASSSSISGAASFSESSAFPGAPGFTESSAYEAPSSFAVPSIAYARRSSFALPTSSFAGPSSSAAPSSFAGSSSRPGPSFSGGSSSSWAGPSTSFGNTSHQHPPSSSSFGNNYSQHASSSSFGNNYSQPSSSGSFGNTYSQPGPSSLSFGNTYSQPPSFGNSSSQPAPSWGKTPERADPPVQLPPGVATLANMPHAAYEVLRRVIPDLPADQAALQATPQPAPQPALPAEPKIERPTSEPKSRLQPNPDGSFEPPLLSRDPEDLFMPRLKPPGQNTVRDYVPWCFPDPRLPGMSMKEQMRLRGIVLSADLEAERREAAEAAEAAAAAAAAEAAGQRQGQGQGHNYGQRM